MLSVEVDWYYKNLQALGRKQERYFNVLALFIFYGVLGAWFGFKTTIPVIETVIPKEYFSLFVSLAIFFLSSSFLGTMTAARGAYRRLLELVPAIKDGGLYSIDEHPTFIDCFVQSEGWMCLEGCFRKQFKLREFTYPLLIAIFLGWAAWLFVHGYVIPTCQGRGIISYLDIVGVLTTAIFFVIAIVGWWKMTWRRIKGE